MLCAALCFIAYLTRSVGVVLVPAIMGGELLRHRRLTTVVVGVPVLFAVLVLVQKQVWGLDASYADQLVFSPRVVAENTYGYVRALSGLWISGYHPVFRVACFAVASLAAAIGFAHRLSSRGQLGPADVFGLLYTVLILVWPSYQGIRFLFPIVPLYFAYAAEGALWASSGWGCFRRARFAGERMGRLLPGGLLAIGLLSYAGAYSTADFGPIRPSATSAESVALYRFVSSSTPAESVFVFRRPRALALFTNRPASVYAVVTDDTAMWSYLDSIDARYIAAGHVFPEDEAFLYPFIQRHRARFEPVYHNSTFDVFCIRRANQECG